MTTVHCPTCGEKVEVDVVVSEVKMSSRRTLSLDSAPGLEVQFSGRWINHRCLEAS